MTGVEIVVIDTDVFSYLHKGSDRCGVFLPLLEGRVAALTFVSIGELWKGAYEANWGAPRIREMEEYIKNHFVVLPPRAELAFKWAEIMAKARKKGVTVHHNDGWIAAAAMVEGCPLVTNNRSHFGGIDGLELLP